MTRDDIRAALISNMESIIEGSKGQPVLESQSLVNDFGADSLEIVEVVSRTMKQLKVKVPRTELGGAQNIGQLLDLFERAAAQATSATAG